MPRPESQETGAVGHDSFLDVVTNMVGILIVLVMVVGMRVKNAPVKTAQDPQVLAASEALEKNEAIERALHREVAETARQIQSVETQETLRRQERDLLATMAAAIEHKLRSQGEKLDAAAQEDSDAARRLADARRTLDRLQKQQTQVRADEDRPQIVQSYPTPLAKTVVGEEAHFQIRGGRVAHVPVEKLLLLARSDAKTKADQLLGKSRSPEFTETVGPEGGFRFRYTATREDRTEQTPAGLTRIAYLKIVRWAVIPVSGDLGEPVETVLNPSSQFRQVLAGLRPSETAVTFWVYRDSFDAFRQLRGELYRLDFPVAARPLPDDALIAGSPRGTKSEAE